MDAFSIGDLAYVLAEHVDCHGTLASLCRVSKRFNDIFTPVLYRKVWLDSSEPNYLERVQGLANDSYCEHIENLDIRYRLRFQNGGDRSKSKAQLAAMDILLRKKMARLRSIV